MRYIYMRVIIIIFINILYNNTLILKCVYWITWYTKYKTIELYGVLWFYAIYRVRNFERKKEEESIANKLL